MAPGKGSGSDLPAEYVDPWRLLRRDLAAVAASTRLRARELWRRNRQADLWHPSIWPEVLAPWFWPLVLILLLSLLALIPIGLNRLRAGAPARVSPPDQGISGIAAPQMVAPQIPPEEPPEEPPAPQIPPLEPAPPEAALPPSPPPSPPPARDPLLAALESDGEPSLLLKASPFPARGLLQLTVAPAFGRLREDQRRQRALAWWTRAREQGYEHIELRDSRGWLQARSSLVGEGLVLFAIGGDEDG